MRVWDLPTRIFHWALALGSWSHRQRAPGRRRCDGLALRIGYAIFTLLAFRLVWGFFGGRWSRFASFAYAPATSLRYLRGQSRPHEHHHVGHNPLGACSVFALLGVLAVQVATGLFADDEIATTGPLIKYVRARPAKPAPWHTSFGQWIIVALAVLHIGAIAFYWLKRRQNLVAPMLHGDKPLARRRAGRDRHAGSRACSRWRLLLARARSASPGSSRLGD